MNMEELLQQYKVVTEEYINSFENLDEAKRLIKRRESILEALKVLNPDKQQLKEVVERLGIVNLDKRAMELTKKESEKVKQEMVELKKVKNANMMYSNSFNNINFVNRKI